MSPNFSFLTGKFSIMMQKCGIYPVLCKDNSTSFVIYAPSNPLPLRIARFRITPRPNSPYFDILMGFYRTLQHVELPEHEIGTTQKICRTICNATVCKISNHPFSARIIAPEGLVCIACSKDSGTRLLKTKYADALPSPHITFIHTTGTGKQILD